MFILYKKYNNSWIATQISSWGFILVLTGSIISFFLVFKVIESTLGIILGTFAGIAVFTILKILLNKLMDKIANNTMEKQQKEEEEMRIPANYLLKTPASLTIICDSNFISALVPEIIFLNEEKAVSIKNGESATISVTMKYNLLRTNTIDINSLQANDINSLQAKNTWYKFEAQDGVKSTIHISAGVFKKNTAIMEIKSNINILRTACGLAQAGNSAADNAT